MTQNENPAADTEPTQDVDDGDTEAIGDGTVAEDSLATESEADRLRIELDQAKSDAVTAKEDVLRARAEVENIRKRAERDVAAAHKFGQERLIGELLPVKDSMDLGFDAIDSASDIDAIREGMVLTRKMFEDALEKAGVKAIDPTGESFDPEFHQAMTMQPSTEAAPGTVLSVMQKGYVLNDRLVRPAMVVVAKAADDES